MLRLLPILALIIFCFAIGEGLAVFVTAVVFGMGTDEVFHSLADPVHAQRDMLLSLACLSRIFRFLVVPAVYLLLTNKQNLSFLWSRDRVRFTRVLLVIALFLAVIPCVSILIELNHNLKLPAWLSGVETYFTEHEIRARQIMASVLAFQGLQGLMVTIIVVAIIPGIVEEIFFRGIIQTQLYSVFRNPRYAVLLSAALFSFFHFQFYGFIPRMVLGVLLGYLFLWSKNIWYPIVAHTINNLVGVLAAYFIGSEIFEPTADSVLTKLLLLPSIGLSVFIIWKLNKMEWGRGDGAIVKVSEPG
jgi:membrane protease YdiL (CAAX protease family)